MLIISPDVASSLVVVDDTTSNITAYPVWTTVTSGNAPAFVSSTKMAVNPSTGSLSVTSLAATTTISVNSLTALTQKDFGYSSAWKSVMIGAASSSQGNVALGVDVSAITGGNFNGTSQVIISRNGILTPNVAGDDFTAILSMAAGSETLNIGPITAGGYSAGPLTLTTSSASVTGTLSASSVVYANGGTGGSVSTPAIQITNNKIITFLDNAAGVTSCGFVWYDSSNNLNLGAGNGTKISVSATGNTTFYPPTIGGIAVGEVFTSYDGWDKQVNIHGTGHSRLTVKTSTVRMGVYSHDSWHTISGVAQGGYVGTYTNHPVSFLVNASPKMVIDIDGDVGIGNTSPAYRLDVDNGGTSGAKLFKFGGTGLVSLFGYSDSGGSGITNTDPFTSGALVYFSGNSTSMYAGSTVRLLVNTSGASVTGTLSSTGAISGSNLSGTNTGDNAANSSTTYVGTTAIALNRSSAAQALTGITSIDGSAATLTTARTINGTSFNGSANILTTEWYHSGRDFPTGTLITTNIDYSVTNGDPWILEIRGNSYGSLIPFDIQVQGYIYSDTIINYGGYSNGSGLTSFSVFNSGGYLCFWFNNAVYWQGFNVRAYTAYGTYALNRVTSIADAAKPGGITKEVSISLVQSLHSSNFSTYAATAGHTHTGVYEPANANIQSHISNTSNPHAVTWAQLGSKPTTVSGFGITDFYSTNSTGATAPDSATTNGHYYSTGLSQLGQTDGGLYVQAYSSSWVGQIYQDYRTGQISLRSKNSGSWTHASNAEWRKVHDTYNLAALGGWTPVVSGVSITGNTFTKTSGASPGWDAQVYSSEGYVTDVMVQFSPVQTDKHIMVGLNSDPTTNADYATLDYSFYLVGSSNVLHIYESGSDVWTGSTFAATDVLTITYNGEYVKYYHNNTLVRTVARALSTTKLYLDSSFYELGSSVANLKFGTTKGDTLYNNAQKYAGHLYSGATDPTNTDRLNYDGYFYATRFYGDGSQLTNLPSPSASPSDIYAFAAAYG